MYVCWYVCFTFHGSRCAYPFHPRALLRSETEHRASTTMESAVPVAPAGHGRPPSRVVQRKGVQSGKKLSVVCRAVVVITSRRCPGSAAIDQPCPTLTLMQEVVR